MVNKPLFSDGWVTKLTNRRVMSVRGRDATDLLQNVSTQDMGIFDKEETRAAVYTGFLSVKGKILFDAIITKPKLASQTSEDMEYWVDLHEDDIEPLKKHLRRYAMRKNVQIEDISHVIKSFSIQTMDGVVEDEGHFFKDL